MNTHASALPTSTDVAILGGGLAGLTLALQLRAQLPDRDIVVLERQAHPVPTAAHKVGESTVEIGAHYLSETLGLKQHLMDEQLRKYGLRLFFDAGPCADLAAAGELGASHLLSVPGYQIDRGILENHLAQRVRDAGILLLDDTAVRDLALDGEGGSHRVEFRRQDQAHSLDARWVVDAMSRGSLIKRRKQLAVDNGHRCSAVWFRIAERIDVAEWSEDADWQQRCSQLPRWLSTNHLMGPGYWVWLIPLASGSTSVGIVFDPAMHDFDQLKTWDGTLQWLEQHQPRCATAIRRARGALQDFLFLRQFSHGCKQVFSSERWALTGEAGVFIDPLYSPGTDFIAISNTYISDLIRRDFAGERIGARVQAYERIYFSFYESTLALYRGQYPLFGHARAMSAKTVWDYAYYWSVLSLFVFAERLTDLAFFGRHASMLDQLRALNLQVQSLFLEWSRHEPGMATRGLFVNQSQLPLLVRLNRELTEVADDPQLDQRLIANAKMLRALAGELRALAPLAAQATVTLHEDASAMLLEGLPEQFLAA